MRCNQRFCHKPQGCLTFSSPYLLPHISAVRIHRRGKWYDYWQRIREHTKSRTTQKAKFMGPKRDPPGSCRSLMGPMLAPWTLLSEYCWIWISMPQTVFPQELGKTTDRYWHILWQPDLKTKWWVADETVFISWNCKSISHIEILAPQMQTSIRPINCGLFSIPLCSAAFFVLHATFSN